MGDLLAGRWPDPRDPQTMPEEDFLAWLLEHQPTVVHELRVDVWVHRDGAL